MKKTLNLVFYVLIFSIGLIAQSNKIIYEKYQLPNGLKVILHQDNSVPVVAVTTLYHVGSKNEDSNRTGFAHFFEHLLFEGTANIKRGEFQQFVTNAGGTLNANTTQDRTFYYELLPSNQVDLGLWLESERMMHANILQEGVNTQREVVKEEKRQRMDNRPYGSIISEILKRAYIKHPYRWSTIGSLEHLNKASLDEFINFYKTFYVPNNCVLTIAGDFDIVKLKEKINAYFADIPQGKKDIPRPNINEDELGKEVRDIIEDNIQLPAVIEAYRTPKQGTKEYYAFRILTNILAEGESSRLNKELVDKKQTAVYIGSIPFFNEDAGLLINFAIANAGNNPTDLEKQIDSITDILKTDLISDKEFEKVKNQIQTSITNENTTMAGIAENLANFEVYFGDANLINNELNKYNEITKKDIQDIAKKYLNKNNRVVLYYVPKTKKQKSKSNS